MPTLKLYVLGNLIDSMPISFKGINDKEERAEHLNGMIQWLKNNNSASLVVHPFEIYLDGVESIASAYIEQNNVDETQRKHEERIQKLKLQAKRENKQIERKTFEHRPVKKKVMDNKYEAPDVKQPFVRPKAEYSNMRLYDLV